MIPFVDIGAQHRELKTAIDDAVARVFESGQFILGPEVEALENEFAAYCGAAYGVGVNSGTSALHLALLAAGVGPGDEVATVPFTFYASVAAIDYVGARPAYVDIDPRTFNIDPAQIEARLTEKTRAILLVHLFGQPADMDPILDLARRYNLAVIEDAAQAHGAEYHGRRAGSIGDIGCFSFYPTKNLGAPGEGGMAVTNALERARHMRLLRDWGQEQKYRPAMKGFNYRLQSLQAAVLRVKLQRLEAWTEARRSLAAEYDRQLEDLDVLRPVTLPGCRHVYCLYTIQVADRDGVRQALAEAGIQTAVHYPLPLHLMPAYADGRYREGDFPAAEACAQAALSIPLYPHMTIEQVGQVCQALRKITASSRALRRPINQSEWVVHR